MLNTLFSQFRNTLKYFAISEPAIETVFTRLVECYSTPSRYYHTLEHIYHILNNIEILQIYTQNLPNVQLAAWFHDGVYNTQANDNEEKSANLACELLGKLGIPENAISHIARLIINTKKHQASPDDVDSQVLIDADLAILAASKSEYQKYADAIRQEYAWVPQDKYIAGRKQVLEKFLQREQIYFTPLMFEMAEAKARLNIEAEIQQLINRKQGDLYSYIKKKFK